MASVIFKGLTDEEKIFIDEYLLTLDYVKAALRIGAKKHLARSMGWTILQRAHVREEIEKRLTESHMTVNEALRRQADIARGDIGDFLAISKNGYSVNLQEAEKLGLTRLIKRVKSKKTFIDGGKRSSDKEIYIDEIELYPADVAQERILKIAGVFKDEPASLQPTTSNFTIPAHMIAPSFVGAYRDITQKLHTEYIFKGGRGSTKSAFVSEMFIYLMINNPLMHGYSGQLMSWVYPINSNAPARQWRLNIYLRGKKYIFVAQTTRAELNQLPRHLALLVLYGLKSWINFMDKIQSVLWSSQFAVVTILYISRVSIHRQLRIIGQINILRFQRQISISTLATTWAFPRNICATRN
jgi:hypothetical protein